MKITVLSDGGWGTALAVNLLNNGHDVTMWGAFPEYLDQMEKTRENVKFLKGKKLHPIQPGVCVHLSMTIIHLR